MKISEISSNSITKDKISIGNTNVNPKTSFIEILSKVAKDLGLNQSHNWQTELIQLASKSNFNPERILSYQIKASQFHMQVEMVSKISESALASARKLQQNQ